MKPGGSSNSWGGLVIPLQEGTGERPRCQPNACITTHTILGNESVLLWLSMLRSQDPTENVVFENGEEQMWECSNDT